MRESKRNLPASVAARLLNRAKQTGDVYQVLLTSFCFERFLHRLGESGVKDRFVLKGAMLFRLWSDQPYRATRDLDLLRRGDGSFDAVRSDIEAVCSVEVELDGIVFDSTALRIEAIRINAEYAGTRVFLPARCGTARLNLQIDMGVGDSVWPPARLRLPGASGFRAAKDPRIPPGSGDRRETRSHDCPWRPQQPDQGFLRPAIPRQPVRVRPRNPGGSRAPNLRSAGDSDPDRGSNRADPGLLGKPFASTAGARVRAAHGNDRRTGSR